MISRNNMAKRILIADDSVTIQKAFAMTFAGAEDFTLASARSADEGLAIAQKTQPDLIIADAVMPGRSGYDLCASIRSDPGLRTVPVLILASSQQPYDEGRGQKAGASGHLTKPWETNAFLERLRTTLRDGLGVGVGGHAGFDAGSVAPAQRVAASLPTAAIEDDEYGEISIDTRDTDDARTPPPVEQRARVATPPPPPPGRITRPSMPAVSAPPAAMAPPPAMVPHAAPGSSAGMRPSLIPGMRPGTMPPARPGTVPARPLAGPPPGPAPGPQSGPPGRPATHPPPVGRTMIGLPAANVPIPGVMRPSAPPVAPAPPARSPTAPAAPLAPARPPTGPVMPLAARGPAPVTPTYAPPPASHAPPPAAYAPPPAVHAPAPHAPAPYAPPPAAHVPAAPAGIGGTLDQRMAAFAAKGPEYEAIAKLSREIIEQIVWEVVPELAEAIIREQVEKRGRS